MENLIELMKRDLSTIQLDAQLGLYHQPTRRWVQGDGEGSPEGFDSEYILRLTGRLQAIETRGDGTASSVEIMNAIQDWVADETGHGWPELQDEIGNYLGLLSPALSETGSAVWAVNDISIPAGRLPDWKARIHS
ncbi:hypothetical protein [Leucobacter sp. G161]|uniref:hypothetical protein n=1 Tax=Leucobacter sp. G161 TaxID=663704 RepID=UPI00073D0564|nr:hypothetical protein [Leucobacter sp. G161]KUF07763.1 hypothetical protein AUL38_07990 [Leucobacter sp. G161]